MKFAKELEQDLVPGMSNTLHSQITALIDLQNGESSI